MISDGDNLYAYGDNSLFYVVRKSPFAFATLRDDQYTLDLNEVKAPDEKAIIVATEPLTTNENWQSIEGLRVFRNGEIIS